MTGVTDGVGRQADYEAIKTMVSDMTGFFAAFQFLAEILWGEPRQAVRVHRTPDRRLR